jgi:hypothetical protein
MFYELTIFKNQYDNKTNRTMKFPDWESFLSLLENLSKISLSGKKDAQLISPAVYREGTTRANRNVEYWGKWAAVDVDTYEGDIYGLFNRFHSFNFCCYSTASSTRATPKFRIVFDLSRPVHKDEIKQFWFALNTFLNELGDPQTKDSSRMYYIPATYSNAFNFFECNHGDPLDVDYLLTRYPYVETTHNSFLDKLPLQVREYVVSYRKQKLTNTNIVWTSYRDCPFWPRPSAAKYQTIVQDGWYRQMYRIMVAIACKAIENNYPITSQQISSMCREFDNDTGGWYRDRPFEVEAERAIQYALCSSVDSSSF